MSKRRHLPIITLASAISGAALIMAGGAAAKERKPECREPRVTSVFDLHRCAFQEYPIEAPKVQEPEEDHGGGYVS